MSKIKKILSYLRRDRVENHTFIYENTEYAKPYQNIIIDNIKFHGLREMDARINLIEKYVGEFVKEKKSYLDIGSNCGYCVNHFSKTFAKAVGIDADSYYISLSQQLYPQVDFLQYDLNNNRLRDIFQEKFDFITALSMIEYIENKKQFVEDVYNSTNFLAVFEGHSEDIHNGNDIIYENLLKEQKWSVHRCAEKTDAGLNACITEGRPIWICQKS